MTTATLRNKIDSHLDVIATFDGNKALRATIRYGLIGTGVLFICYSYFVGAITFSVIKQQALEQSTKGLISTMSNQERMYLQTQQGLTQESAAAVGLVQSTAVVFATAKPALAFNVEQ
jgi:hypothetical protein